MIALECVRGVGLGTQDRNLALDMNMHIHPKAIEGRWSNRHRLWKVGDG